MSDQGNIAPPIVPPAPPRTAWRRVLPLVLVAGCVAGGTFTLVLMTLGRGETTLLITEWSHFATGGSVASAPAEMASAPRAAAREGARATADPATPSAAPAKPPAAAAEPKDAPSFDIVRVAPTGAAVVAGRAAPGAEVAVANNGIEIGHARADAQGQWVIVPQAALAPGGGELTLAARGADGAVVAGAAPVIVVVPSVPVPGAGASPAPAMAVLTPQDAAPRLLQGPSPPPLPASPAPGEAGRPGPLLGLEVVDYDEQGRIRFAGGAPPGAEVRLYVDDQAVGDARSDAQGRWSLTPERTVDPGTHRLRLDQLADAQGADARPAGAHGAGAHGTDAHGSDAGRVASRIELPFQRVSLPPEALDRSRVVVQPGQSLWAIARRVYGQGTRYTVIYAANREQIRNPDLIYPGQIFAMPDTGEQATQAASEPAKP